MKLVFLKLMEAPRRLELFLALGSLRSGRCACRVDHVGEGPVRTFADHERAFDHGE